MFVRFRKAPTTNYAALKLFFAQLKAYKEAARSGNGNKVSLEQCDFWVMSPPTQRHFYLWNDGQLTAEQIKVKGKLPEPRFDDEKWNVEELLESLKTSDYLLDELADTGAFYAELRIKDAGDSFDGLDDLLELLEAFALEIVGYQDGGSYIELSSG